MRRRSPRPKPLVSLPQASLPAIAAGFIAAQLMFSGSAATTRLEAGTVAEPGLDLVRTAAARDDPRPIDPSSTPLFLTATKGPRADSRYALAPLDGEFESDVPVPNRVLLAARPARTPDADSDKSSLAADVMLLLAGLGADPAGSPLTYFSTPLLATTSEPDNPDGPANPGLDLTRLAVSAENGQHIFFGGLTEREFRVKETRCLATAIYFEARGEPVEGQLAVAQTIMNRVRSSFYPDTVCGVVYQGAERRTGCQFSFACDKTPDVAKDRARWEIAQDLARQVADGKVWLKNIGNATHYHATYVRPGWIRQMRRITRIGVHIFYRGTFLPEQDQGSDERLGALSGGTTVN